MQLNFSMKTTWFWHGPIPSVRAVLGNFRQKRTLSFTLLQEIVSNTSGSSGHKNKKNLLVHQDREHDYREGKIFQDLLTLYRQNFGAACKDTINSLRNFVKLEECCPVYKETRVIHAVFASDGTQIYGILCLSLTTPIVHSICHWKVKRIHRQVVFREFRFVKVHWIQTIFQMILRFFLLFWFLKNLKPDDSQISDDCQILTCKQVSWKRQDDGWPLDSYEQQAGRFEINQFLLHVMQLAYEISMLKFICQIIFRCMSRSWLMKSAQ